MGINSTLEQLKVVELEMLKEFISVCKKLNLRYYALGGTLLGAVRHKGFFHGMMILILVCHALTMRYLLEKRKLFFLIIYLFKVFIRKTII